MISQILTGVVTGAGYAVAGWQASAKPNVELDLKRLTKTAVVCAVVGGIVGYSGADFNLAITGALGITTDKIIGMLWKVFGKKIMKVVTKIKKKLLG